MNTLQAKIQGTDYSFLDVLRAEYEKYFSFVKTKELSKIESEEFEVFCNSFFKDKIIPFQDQLTKLEFNVINKYKKADSTVIQKEIEDYEATQALVKKLPNVSDDLIQRLHKEITRALKLNEIFNKYLNISGTKYNELDIFPITGMFFLPAFLELVERNSEYIKKYMSHLTGLPPDQDIFISPHIYRVEKGQSGTFLHNDFNQHVIDKFDAVESFANGRKILFYHLALTNITRDTCGLILYPDTHNEFVTYAYAFQHIVEHDLFLNKEEEITLLKAFYLSKKGLNGLPARLCLLNKYYLDKYKNDIEGLTAYLNKGEGIFFNPFVLHSSHATHSEDNPRITIALRITNVPTKFFKHDYFDFLTKSLALLYGLEHNELLNILYDHKEPNREQYLEILMSGANNQRSNITFKSMHNLFMKTKGLFEKEQLEVTDEIMKTIQGYLKKYNT